jgi:hypothetical protein
MNPTPGRSGRAEALISGRGGRSGAGFIGPLERVSGAAPEAPFIAAPPKAGLEFTLSGTPPVRGFWQPSRRPSRNGSTAAFRVERRPSDPPSTRSPRARRSPGALLLRNYVLDTLGPPNYHLAWRSDGGRGRGSRAATKDSAPACPARRPPERGSRVARAGHGGGRLLLRTPRFPRFPGCAPGAVFRGSRVGPPPGGYGPRRCRTVREPEDARRSHERTRRKTAPGCSRSRPSIPRTGRRRPGGGTPWPGEIRRRAPLTRNATWTGIARKNRERLSCARSWACFYSWESA